jgi:hypothetical protein
MVREYTSLFDEADGFIDSSAPTKKTNLNSSGRISGIYFPVQIKTRIILYINSITKNPRRH